MNPIEMFHYTFFTNALLCALLASVLCGMVGTYIVTRRLVFVSGGITHASFGGVGIGVLAGVNPILSAMLFSVACACGVQWLSRKGAVREDSAIAVAWTLGMSVGIICCSLTPGFMSDLSSYLFGSILAVGTGDIILLTVLTMLVGLVFVAFLRVIVLISYDPLFARTRHIHSSLVEYAMMIIISLTIVSILRLVGIVLAMSLLTIPQMTANSLTHSYRRMILLSIVFGWIGCTAGLVLSFLFNIPSGASIILVSVVIYALVRLVTSRIHSIRRIGWRKE